MWILVPYAYVKKIADIDEKYHLKNPVVFKSSQKNSGTEYLNVKILVQNILNRKILNNMNEWWFKTGIQVPVPVLPYPTKKLKFTLHQDQANSTFQEQVWPVLY